MIKLRVRNVCGIVQADLEVRDVVLVAGLNGAGKSSLLQSCASAALNTPLARGLATKKAAAGLLREGAERGSVTLEYDAGSVRINYPEATTELVGRPEFFGSKFGLGTARFTDLKQDARLSDIIERFQAHPLKADLATWFGERPKAGMDTKALDLVWGDIEVSGWDAEATRYRAHGTKIRGRWEEVTGVRWGERVRKTWAPPGMHIDEDYDLEAAIADVATAREEQKALGQSQAVSTALRAQLDTDALDAQPAAEALQAAQAETETLTPQAEDLIEQIDASKGLVDAASLPTCPHCGLALKLLRGRDGATFVEKAPEALSAVSMKAAVAAATEARAKLATVQRLISAQSDAVVRASARATVAERARAELLRMAAIPIVDEAAIEASREKVITLEGRARNVRALLRSKELSEEFDANALVVEALEPSGVRQGVLNRKLSEFATLLGTLSAAAKFQPIDVTEELEFTYGGRTYALLSESEQWRVDLVISAALGSQEGAKMLLVDRLDVLHAQARGGVIEMLRTIGRPSIVTMTAKDPLAAPNLPSSVGRTMWLVGGKLGPRE